MKSATRTRTTWAILLLACIGLALPMDAAADARNRDESIGWPGETLDGFPCSGRDQGYGPYDYSDPRLASNVKLVDDYHFKPGVEHRPPGRLPGGQRDIPYTLSAIPNHYRALYFLVREAAIAPDMAAERTPPAECWFQRAIAFKRSDALVRQLFGMYLHRTGHHELALAQYEAARKMGFRSAELHYNTGLLLVDMERYPEALEQARLAYQLGYPLPGLKQKLEQVGHW